MPVNVVVNNSGNNIFSFVPGATIDLEKNNAYERGELSIVLTGTEYKTHNTFNST
jgi:hypothetical protein